jgi:hypothetical protein
LSSWCCAAQCCRFVTLRLGVRYPGSMSVIFMVFKALCADSCPRARFLPLRSDLGIRTVKGRYCTRWRPTLEVARFHQRLP